MLKTAPAYHAHIYFLPEELDQADAMRARAFADLEGLATVWPVRRVPVGAHAGAQVVRD